jgi:drug/metabolite transporter (DMT)-like permease
MSLKKIGGIITILIGVLLILFNSLSICRVTLKLTSENLEKTVYLKTCILQSLIVGGAIIIIGIIFFFLGRKKKSKTNLLNK